MEDKPFRLLDHIDLRVKDLAASRAFYDAFMRAFHLRGRPFEEGCHVYVRTIDRVAHEAVVLIEDHKHAPSAVRIAFAAPSREEVDRITAAAVAAGAHNVEGPMPCPEYIESYYAAFFEDPDGNRLEVCYR
jgi:predicted lactoylglutathione lyase